MFTVTLRTFGAPNHRDLVLPATSYLCVSQVRTSSTDIDVCSRAVLRRACTCHMRTDSADEVKHFRFVGARARRHVLGVFTHPRATKPARNARCVDRSSTKADDSSRAVANTRDVARFDASRRARERTPCVTKRNLLRRSHPYRFAPRCARVDALWTRHQRDVVARSARIRRVRSRPTPERARSLPLSRVRCLVPRRPHCVFAPTTRAGRGTLGHRNVADATKPGTKSRA